MESKVLTKVKKVAVEFIAIVFIVGFFSKSFSNYFLPKVFVYPAIEGSVESRVNLVGTLEPREKVEIRLGADIIVDEYFVNVGKKVSKGDPIFKIDESYGITDVNEEIERLEIQLEREKLDLEKFTGSPYMLEEKKLVSKREKIDKKKEELTNSEKLYETGAISASQLESKKEIVKNLELDLEIAENNLKDKNKERYLQIKDKQLSIDSIKKEINKKKRRQSFYSKLGEDGIYYSEVDGIILNTSETNRLLRIDTPIVEIGMLTDYSSLIFKSYINERYNDLVTEGSIIKIKSEDMKKSVNVKITNIYSISENGMLKVEGEFPKETKGRPILGKKLKGEVTKEIKGNFVIPKTAVIPDEEFKSDTRGRVYVLEERDGVLGKEYVAVEVEVTIFDIGDDRVSVYGMDLTNKSKVITNLSYKIKDGVKVFPWK